jgi:hypothetical protein
VVDWFGIFVLFTGLRSRFNGTKRYLGPRKIDIAAFVDQSHC